MANASADRILAQIERQWAARVAPMLVICAQHFLGGWGLLAAALGSDPLSGQPVSGSTYQLAIATYFLFGLSITAGYHRLFSHRSYEASRALTWALLLVASGALQGQALRWAWQHRVHHRHSDSAADPHNRRAGWWHSHMGWIFDKSPEFKAAAARESVADLLADRAVRLQHYYWLPVGLLLCYGAPALAGAARGGEAWTSFLVAGAARHLLVWCARTVRRRGPAPPPGRPRPALPLCPGRAPRFRPSRRAGTRR